MHHLGADLSVGDTRRTRRFLPSLRKIALAVRCPWNVTVIFLPNSWLVCVCPRPRDIPRAVSCWGTVSIVQVGERVSLDADGETVQADPRRISSGSGRAEELRAEDLVVELALPKELFVGSAGGDLTFVEDQDQVRVTYGAHPLGYYEHGTVALSH